MDRCNRRCSRAQKILARAGSRRHSRTDRAGRPRREKNLPRRSLSDFPCCQAIRSSSLHQHFKSDRTHRRALFQSHPCLRAAVITPKTRHELSEDICRRFGSAAARLRLAHVRRQPAQAARPTRGTDPTPPLSYCISPPITPTCTRS